MGSPSRRRSRRSRIRSGIIVDDDAHPERQILIGMSWKERILFTVFIEPGDDETRLISARMATRAERRRYEEVE